MQLPSRSLAPPTGAWHWLDQKSRPAAHTHGDLPEASYIQAAIGGAVEGLAMGGLSGALSASLASTVGIWTERRTGNAVAGMAAGIAVGAALGAGVAYLTNQPELVSRTVSGGLLGCFATLGGAATASVRDASDMGAVASGLFLPGASKATGGVASALASRYGADLHPAARSALGAGLGAGLAVAFGALGASPVSPALMVASSALGGAVGPVVGPRFGQLIRNVSHDLGGAMESGARRAGIVKKPLSRPWPAVWAPCRQACCRSSASPTSSRTAACLAWPSEEWPRPSNWWISSPTASRTTRKRSTLPFPKRTRRNSS